MGTGTADQRFKVGMTRPPPAILLLLPLASEVQNMLDVRV